MGNRIRNQNTVLNYVDDIANGQVRILKVSGSTDEVRGSGLVNEIAFWTNPDYVTGSADLSYNDTAKALTVSGSVEITSSLSVVGATSLTGVLEAVDASHLLGDVSIGTSVVPVGGVGYAKFVLHGVDSDGDTGPHIQITTDSDDHPLMQVLPWKHDDIAIAFDVYWGNGAYRSSDAGSNFQIHKAGDKLKFEYDSGIAAGSTVSLNDGIVLNTSGDVGIGAAGPTNRLHVHDDVASEYVARFVNDGSNVNRYGIKVQCGDDNGVATGATNYFWAQDGNGTSTGVLKTVNGVFQLTDVSDERKKGYISPTKINGLDIVSKIDVVEFSYGTMPYIHPVGFIAQQVEKVFPYMVGEDTEEDGSKTKSITKTSLIPVLTKAIQELSSKLDTALDRIAALEN